MFFPRALPHNGSAGIYNQRPTKNEFKAMSMMKFTCQCCGFKAEPSKEVPTSGLEFVSINGKLTLLCIMCAQSQMLTRPVMLDSGQKELNHGRLVYCPEVTQGKIVNVVRDIVALSQFQKNNPNRSLRIHIENLRESFVETILRRCTNIPALKINNNDLAGYATTYRFASTTLLKHEREVFGSVRYVPDELIFSGVVKHWLTTTYRPILEEL